MGRAKRREKKAPESPVQPEAEEHEDGQEAGSGAGGWKASTAGLAGAARVTRVGAWVLVASGPLLGAAALLSPASPAQSASKEAPAVRQASSGTGPAGFAQLFVSTYLEAGQGSEKSLAPYYAGPVTLTAEPGTRSVGRAAVTASREVEPGYWSVTVAANVAVKDKKGSYGPAGVQYYRVGVQAVGPKAAGGAAASGDNTGYTATSLPAQVAAPASLKPSDLGYGTNRGSGTADPAAETAGFFLNSYLAGKGELDRYTSPGVHLRPVAPAPYTEVKVTSAEDDSGSTGTQKVPSDGARRRLLVTVTATDKDGHTFPLSYALSLTSRGGRWEVAALDEAPVLKPGSQPSAAATSTPDPDGASAGPAPTPPHS